MKRFLLCASLAAFAISLNAETKYYAADPTSVYGLLTGISDNGRYAVASDNEDNIAYLCDLENSTEFTLLGDDALLNDVANNGLAVGALFNGTVYRAAIYNNGDWDYLATHPEVMNEQYAVCITPDAKVIAGYEFDRDSNAERGGRYFPVAWILDENTDEYELIKFNDLQLPDHQGFITECLSPDGKYIGGRLYCASMSEIPALIDIENHEIIYWDTIETRIEPFEYKGQILGYFEEYYIDGYHDTSSDNTFSGEFLSCDADGNFYGYRTVALKVSDDGQEADLGHYASIYNVNTKEWVDMEGISAFSLGYNNGRTLFASNAKMVTISESGEVTQESIYDGLHFSTSDDISAITRGSADGKVLGGIYGIFNPAKQAPDYHPFLIILDEALSGITEIAIDNESNIMIITSEGHIEVAGANSVAVYDLGGKLVSASASCDVAPGMYIVNADNVSRKVIVK